MNYKQDKHELSAAKKKKYSWDMDFDAAFEKDLENYLAEEKKNANKNGEQNTKGKQTSTYRVSDRKNSTNHRGDRQEYNDRKSNKREKSNDKNDKSGDNYRLDRLKAKSSEKYQTQEKRKSRNSDQLETDNKSKNLQGGKRGFDQKMSDKKQIEKKQIGYKVCPAYKKCGGCQLQGLSYEEQLEKKRKKLSFLLKEFGPIEPIIGMKNPTHYRHKIHSTFTHDRQGNVLAGVYEEGSHRVVPVESCMIEHEKAGQIVASICKLCKSFKIKAYNEDSGYGLLRHVLIRVGKESKEIMVVLVLASPILPGKNNFIKALRELHPEITTILINVNDKNTSMVLGDREILLYGKGYIEDTLCGKVFRISAKSFYQVNPEQTEILYRKAIEFAGFNGTETVIDAYCGVGTIGIIMSDQVSKVIGVELNRDAIKDARVNAKRNDIKNIDFVNADASDYMVNMAADRENVDVVIMDPPRTGSDERFLTSVATLAPKKIVYVSCNPETLARDLKVLTKKGYQVEKMCPVDLFAFTEHVEMVCLLSRKA